MVYEAEIESIEKKTLEFTVSKLAAVLSRSAPQHRYSAALLHLAMQSHKPVLEKLPKRPVHDDDSEVLPLLSVLGTYKIALIFCFCCDSLPATREPSSAKMDWDISTVFMFGWLTGKICCICDIFLLFKDYFCFLCLQDSEFPGTSRCKPPNH